jgi:hypothetical protein
MGLLPVPWNEREIRLAQVTRGQAQRLH